MSKCNKKSPENINKHDEILIENLSCCSCGVSVPRGNLAQHHIDCAAITAALNDINEEAEAAAAAASAASATAAGESAPSNEIFYVK